MCYSKPESVIDFKTKPIRIIALMKRILSPILLFALLHFQPQSLSGQSDSTVISELVNIKNAIHGSAGYLLLGGTLNGFYERMIGESSSSYFSSYWVGAGFGGMAYWDERWRFINIDFAALSGQRNNHMEFRLGVATFKDMWGYRHPDGYDPSITAKYPWRSFAPTGAIGYRFQKPGESFVFRTGAGFPHGLYVGIGFRF